MADANNKLVERKLFAGPRIRRLRREQRLTQAAMAEALGISTSYLNLIERDQRPISAQILLQLIDVFDIDPRGLAGDEEARAQTQLHEVFSDPMFRDTPLSKAELKDLAAASPASPAPIMTICLPIFVTPLVSGPSLLPDLSYLPSPDITTSVKLINSRMIES